MKRIWKKMLAVLLVSTLVCTLAACSTTPPTAGAAGAPTPGANVTKTNEEIKIVTILISSASQVTTSMGNAIETYAEGQGAQCSVEYYEKNIANQASMIENAVTSGADIIIMQNQSAGDCVNEITKATDAGIVVILYGDDVPDAEYTYLFTEDSHALGKQLGSNAGKWANENLVANGEPVIAAVGNYSVTPLAVRRYEGIVEGLTEICPEAEIVGPYEMAYKEEGLVVGENILQSNPDTNLVVGINDQSVCGVYEAFVAAGRENETIGMYGIDGTDEALYYISKDTMYKGVFSVSPNSVGEQMVDCGLAKVKNDPSAPADKVVYWPADEITLSNIDDYKDNWGHLADE